MNKKRIIVAVVGVAVAVAMIASARYWLGTRIGFYVQQSQAMYPTIRQGQFVQVDKQALRRQRISRFDLIAFKYPKDKEVEFVMRVVGMPGETIQLVSNGVLVNGNLLVFPTCIAYLSTNREASGVLLGVEQAFKVPNDEFFVIGDNRAIANDSRFWGGVPKRLVVGKVVDVFSE